jgi:hypothetical protein
MRAEISAAWSASDAIDLGCGRGAPIRGLAVRRCQNATLPH